MNMAGDVWSVAGVGCNRSMRRQSCCIKVHAWTFGEAGTRISAGTRRGSKYTSPAADD